MSVMLRCRRSLVRVLPALLLGVSVAGALVRPCAAAAATAGLTSQQVAEALVDTALRYEISESDSERSRLLAHALEQSPDCAPARWHSGQVWFAGRWVKIDEVPALARDDQRYREYLRVRREYSDTAAGHLALGAWCENRRLDDQARAHLTKVIELDPDHLQARCRLGYRRVAGVWITREEFRQMRDRARQRQRNLVAWRPEIQRLYRELIGENATRQPPARERLLRIHSPQAIPALETVLSEADQRAALLLVEVLGQITDHAAALALARQAVFSPQEAVRLAASKRLQSRPTEAFVPAMLAAMHTPIRSSPLETIRGPRGTLIYRQTFSREGQAATEEAVVETAYVALDPGNLLWYADRGKLPPISQADLEQTIWRRQLSVARQNVRSRDLNRRIADALNVATGQQLPASSAAWWKWWDDYNEYRSAAKPRRRRHYRQYRRMISCFAAATPVWTVDGPKPIERVQVGDLVLSQDPASGELAYKPVLRITRGSPVELVTVTAGDESFDCTGGHPFWVSGEGWARARKLPDDAMLHGVTGTIRVGQVETGSVQKTHNLVVADFHTYFVGRQKILVHDVTPREPTTTLVPGLQEP